MRMLFPVTPSALLIVIGALGLSGPCAAAEDANARGLSMIEMVLADCVGRALAIEQALHQVLQTNDGTAAQAASDRADALLRVSVNRYVAVGRIEAFRRRAAMALAAENLRMSTTIEIGADPGGTIARASRRLDTACGTYLD